MATKIDYPLAPGDKGLATVATRPRVSPALTLIAGWLIPGAGHLLLGKWVRGLLLMLSIIGMFAVGVALHGKVYTANTGEPLDMLGFAGDVGSGALYLLARLIGWGQDPVLIAIAGISSVCTLWRCARSGPVTEDHSSWSSR